MDFSQDTVASDMAADGEPFRLRSYQAEMVEESLHANIIVVMDTGSGKTHIAIERTRVELEMSTPNKIVWFLAPTVTLCEQQYEVFKSNLPSYGIQLLSGRDNVDHWTTQDVWDAVLHDIRIVVSTHQVLLDALTHAFVKLSNVALLIFDEAHHCTGKHPAHRIMAEFYQPLLNTDPSPETMPRVLGLSASPVITAAAPTQALEQIERNLQATARTPKTHRSELVQFVHKPDLIEVSFSTSNPIENSTPLFRALENAHISYDLRTDPYVLELIRKQENGYDCAEPLESLFKSKNTYCNEQLRMLINKAKDTVDELGLSAMEWYLHQCITQFRKTTHVASNDQFLDTFAHEEHHLLSILDSLPLSEDILESPMVFTNLSHKVNKLIDVLCVESKKNSDFTGLLFVEQRVWVTTLAQILATHPRTKNLFRIGTFVGTSKTSKSRANIANSVEPRNQPKILDDFRAGHKNLIVTTSILDEGIDIASCNVVICFERPKNLKVFVQRRGRARKKCSKYIILTPQDGEVHTSESWKSLEAEMRREYENDLRLVKEANERGDNDRQGDDQVFRIPSTGACITLDNAYQHLNHFCALSVATPFADSRPQFQFTETQSGLISSRVTLPISIDSSIRQASSLNSWKTEKMARKDAALEAYKALYLAGLINNNLLPIRRTLDTEMGGFDQTPSMVGVSPLLNPWPTTAQFQQNMWHSTLLTVRAPAEEAIRILLLTQVPIPPSSPKIVLHWDREKDYHVEMSHSTSITLNEQNLRAMRFITWYMLYYFFYGRMQEKKDDFVWLLAPCDSSGRMLDEEALSVWQKMMQGQQSLSSLISSGRFDPKNCGLISRQGERRRFMLNTETANYSTVFEIPTVWANPVPKRRDFLHPVSGGNTARDSKSKAEPLILSECTVDDLPARYSLFALLLPPILHKLEVSLIVESLRTTVLQPVSFGPEDLPLLIKTLTASSANAHENYQRLEFLGDCILKFIASLHLMAANPKDPESFLTQKKGNLVSNGFLSQAAMAARLDQFIFVKPFTAAKWKPRLVSDMAPTASIQNRGQISSKTISDVIESTIGASFLVGGFSKAYTCVQTLLPLEKWTPLSEANSILFELAPTGHAIADLRLLESLIGYTFNKRMLAMDAMTHASYLGPNVNCSYQRLEFLGDAVLDYLVTAKLYDHTPELPHQEMHGIRTAMVNASFLAFRMLETTVEQGLTNKATMQTEMHSRGLWQFLRYSSPEVRAARDAALLQHQAMRGQIAKALEQDTRFPWHLLALTDPPKFLSDIVESTLGAVYVDSRGDMGSCERFARRFGILDCLDRIMRDGVDCLHPKERLGHLAVNRSVNYLSVEANPGQARDLKTSHWCQVMVGGEKVGDRVGGPRRLNAETIAASLASLILEGTENAVMSDGSEEDTFFDAEEGGGGVLLDGW